MRHPFLFFQGESTFLSIILSIKKNGLGVFCEIFRGGCAC